MLIDCSTCAAKPVACADCVVTVLLGMPGEEPELDATERRAIDALADGGLIPPLRLVPLGLPAVARADHQHDHQAGHQADRRPDRRPDRPGARAGRVDDSAAG